MLILFALTVIIYLLIGIKVIKLQNHSGKSIWGLIIFISTIVSVLLAYISVFLRWSDKISNLLIVAGVGLSLVFVLKYYFLNKASFHWLHLVHMVYSWVGFSLVSTLIMELIPFRTNAIKAVWGFYIGLAVIVFLILNLVISISINKNNEK